MARKKSNVNREYKDRLFKFLFGSPSRRSWALDLYNAMNGSHYADENALVFTTIEDVVYMGMKNDVSFLIDSTMCFLEQQSTYNRNMPARFFAYSGMIYAKLMNESPDFDPYALDLQRLPDPMFVCLCNAPNWREERKTLRLSDAFGKNSRKRLELLVDVVNINYGRNKELLEACPPLKDYSFFVSRVRYYLKRGMTLEQAVDASLNDMSNDAVIKPALLANQAEVKRMCLLEYDEEKTLRGRYEKGKSDGIKKGIKIGEAKGREEGLEEGLEKGLSWLANFVKSGVLTIGQASSQAGMTESEFAAKTGLKL